MSTNDFEYACNDCGRQGHYGEFTHIGPGLKCPSCKSTDVGAAPKPDDDEDDDA